MGDAVNLATTVHAFNKILAQPKLSSRTRTPEDVEDSVKKLRRLILIEGIPSRVVCARLTAAARCVFIRLAIFAGSHVTIQNLENPA
jgi:hypothetical protein